MSFLRWGFLLLVFAGAGTDKVAVWTETFAEGRLDPGRWQITSAGDFRQRDVSVVGVPDGVQRFRLALSIDTRGTKDETVKVIGVRSVRRVRLSAETRISLDLDWNQQTNGSYLSAAAVLAPQETSQDALTSPDWLKVEYVGVPPGKNARMVVGVKRKGQERTLYNEGWPEINRAGRSVGLQHVMIVLGDERVQVWENGAPLYTSSENVTDFDEAHLYLQVSSHSNYPRRTVHFGNVRVEEQRQQK